MTIILPFVQSVTILVLLVNSMLVVVLNVKKTDNSFNGMIPMLVLMSVTVSKDTITTLIMFV
jgi:cell division protein FtsX